MLSLHVLFEIPDPPYFLIGIAAVCGLACGKAFEVSIKRKTKEWSEGRSSQPLSKVYEVRLFVPYLGICVCSWVFVGSALTTFAVTWAIGFAMSTVVVVSSGLLVWFQLKKLLKTLEEGGSKALEI
ncbi:hypothetical protein [Acaryochloris sp. IP29b_bin.148]|uniref:hypothetical protein n=1 Tax=Acaryochloris sp. IP29b_bin.148 TaxID=2969218 RepID=UPI0026172861|nr:hypothetical protein [Acaryochloris sp. IP29b_bin.148]